MDLITAPEDHVDLSKFSISKHAYIVEYKTAYYSFYLPVALSMRLAGITDESAYKQALAVLLPLGEYFQVQDDYLDCYGAPEVIGKIGTDIMDNKCSWLINQALARASVEQRALLEVCIHIYTVTLSFIGVTCSMGYRTKLLMMSVHQYSFVRPTMDKRTLLRKPLSRKSIKSWTWNPSTKPTKRKASNASTT
jgi:hypothetical protein